MLFTHGDIVSRTAGFPAGRTGPSVAPRNVPRVGRKLTGVRRDRWAEANRIAVETEKAGADKGRFLNPELWDQPEQAGIHFRPPRRESFRNLPVPLPEDRDRQRSLADAAGQAAAGQAAAGRTRLEEQWQQIQVLVERMRPA